ncbi:hypothetical protein DVK44_17555 [Streptomyces paludis]|uniref:Uncharacterized protein n=1 Tax=Streptomyces paludis TaxID=2282738 RepID=A0A345HR51_9ACTN|nr:hypothetical protein DVK44_17555 [Streptomyces paludis]
MVHGRQRVVQSTLRITAVGAGEGPAAEDQRGCLRTADLLRDLEPQIHVSLRPLAVTQVQGEQTSRECGHLRHMREQRVPQLSGLLLGPQRHDQVDVAVCHWHQRGGGKGLVGAAVGGADGSQLGHGLSVHRATGRVAHPGLGIRRKPRESRRQAGESTEVERTSEHSI